MRKRTGLLCAILTIGLMSVGNTTSVALAVKPPNLEQSDLSYAIWVLVDAPRDDLAVQLARENNVRVYCQEPNREDAARARQTAERAGRLGSQIFIGEGPLDHLNLAGNVADAVMVFEPDNKTSKDEALRVLRPGGKLFWGKEKITKPTPKGVDDWSHPYHGPDNNPLSNDQLARAPYLTQFLAGPRYGSIPQCTVISAGRVFKAFGNVAFKEREEAFLNKLVAFNGYNGTMLWQRDLVPGIMVHRNTMIATPDVLYVGDDKSCKLIDTKTGETKGEIKPPEDVAGGTFWKWMAMQDGVLYAVIGERELKDPDTRRKEEGHGWSWSRISKGYNQKQNEWGLGRTVLAIDLATKKVLWHHREEQPIDCRAVCMNDNSIFLFRFGSFLTCLDAPTGKVIWRKTPDNAPAMFESIGQDLNRQSWQTNWRTVIYMTCSDRLVYFAGPQVNKLLAVSANSGEVAWEDEYNNYQLVLRDEGLYGISGPWGHNVSKKFEPLTGAVLASYDVGRRACTRVTGSVDAIFSRAMGGTQRFDIAGERRQWMSPMRPGCFDGVMTANGLLYWFPFVCDCQLQLYGMTCLGPAGHFNFTPKATEADRLQRVADDPDQVTELAMSSKDWPTYRANVRATAISRATIAKNAKPIWTLTPKASVIPTAPTTVNGLAFVAGTDGIVKAIDVASGELKWKAYTGGAVRYPPTIWKNRALVGSGDGYVYAFEAATGRLLWRFRAAPTDRLMPVYGALLSTWPVGSGVLVDDKGTAYAAAGIANYDGTYVYALDAATGAIKWQNNTSGHLDPEARTGVSVQGHFLLNGDKLYMAGGTSVSPAVYETVTGKCLNDPAPLQRCESVSPRGQDLTLVGDHVVATGRPLYADIKYKIFDHTVKSGILHASTSRRDIVWIDRKKLMCFAPIDKQKLNNCVEMKITPRHIIQHWGEFKIDDAPKWTHECPDSVAVALCANAVVVADHKKLTALAANNGQEIWSQKLPAKPVSYGLAIDRNGQVIVTLEDGRIMCFAPGA